MCLIIQNTKPKPFDKDGFCISWKIISRNNRPLFFIGPQNPYTIGENTSNRYNEYTKDYRRSERNPKVFLLEEPIAGGGASINLGFHVCLTREDARRMKKGLYGKTCKLIKVFYKPEDVVAYGVWSDNTKIKSLVVDKLTVKSLKPLR